MQSESDVNLGNDNYYRDVNKQLMIIPPPHTWSWTPWRRPKWNGKHQLLPFAPSPSISTCTTSTNLSDFQSNSTIYKKKGMTLGENLRHTIQEIEPLQHGKASKDDINFGSENLESSDDLCQNDDIKGASRRRMLPQLIAAIAVSWVSMVIGYASAYTSPATLSLKTDLQITDYEVSWICGLMPLSALFGGLMGGPLIEFLGRKWTLLVTDSLFLVAWIINYFSQQYWQMYLSRVIVGSGVGIATLTLPVYLGETIQPEVRGSLGLLPTAFGNIGILICYLLGNVFEWKGLAGIGILLPIPFLVLIWLIPETPRWYMSKGKIEEARTALEWLRGKTNKHWVDKEFEDLMKSQKISDEKSDGLSELFSKTNVKSLLIVLGLMFFQQMSGINAVIFYTTQIFKDAGTTLDPSLCTTIVGVVNFISTFIATVLIDRAGRKALLYISSSAMIVTLGILGAYFYLMNATTVDVKPYGWVPLANMVIYVLGFSLGYGPIPWLMMGEILPAKIRGPAASVATGFNWTCTFIVTTTFPQFIHIMGPQGAFWMFCAMCAIGLVFTILFVPETRGQSLEDIERKLAGIKVRRMSSVANLKPLQSTF